MDEAVFKDIAVNVAGYFRDFLESDFRRIQAPTRKIVFQTEAGFRCGMRIKPYENLERDIWKLLQQQSSEPMVAKMAPRKYTKAISPILQKVIEEQLQVIDATQVEAVQVALTKHVANTYSASISDPEEWIESTVDQLQAEVSQTIVRPLIGRLDGPLQKQAYSVIDSLYAAEVDMVLAVSTELATKLPDVLAKHLAKRDDEALKTVVETFLTLEHTKEALQRFFANFVTADAFLEFRDLETYSAITEGVVLYLYLGAVKFRSVQYPLMFLPVQVDKLADGAGYELTVVNQLFANRAAIDYILQELAQAKMREWVSPITDRIHYISPQQSVFEVARGLFGLIANAMDLAGKIDFSQSAADASTADVTLSTGAFLCAYERGAESLVNDYEALIDAAKKGGNEVVQLFEDMVKGILTENPKSIRQAVDDEWDALPLVERLVFDTPIPLNEEQRRVLMAVAHPQGRIVVVEGPPGTGKSHTITAIAADCAFNQRSCLILSDKQEALQVVHDKLSNAMSRVRHDSNFPNPILRLGRQDANFKRLVANQTIAQVSAYTRAMKANASHIEGERKDTSEKLKGAIELTAETLGNINLSDIKALHDLEHSLEDKVPLALKSIREMEVDDAMAERLAQLESDINLVGAYFKAMPAEALSSLATMKERARRDKVAGDYLSANPGAAQELATFECLSEADVKTAATILLQFKQLKMPILGYLLRGSAIRALELKLNELATKRPLLLKQDAKQVEKALKAAGELRQRLEHEGFREALKPVTAQITTAPPDARGAAGVVKAMEALARLPEGSEEVIRSGPDTLCAVMTFMRLWTKTKLAFAKAPAFDYVGSKQRLEDLNTSRMNSHVDSRLVEFMEDHRADAKTLAQLISRQQKFPEDKFDVVRRAFPVVIAGIREFGEYVPLLKDLFDVVVIDEGSQVSVAQALPAILRGKKVVVFGDSKQFANVKSTNASNATNEKYRSNLVGFVENKVTRDAGTLERLAMFDVKKSVLEFCSLAASFTIMLRKHFRSYPELISYSSKNFYQGQLQAIKIRGVPLEEVVQFHQIDASGKHTSRTTNEAEADHIAAQLEDLIEQDDPPTVGIITPFREQHTLLTKLLYAHPKAQEFEEKLRLKIMTFDSCQGEERSIIFYSMVATPGKDALAYIFPVLVENASDDVEGKLKVQRLNVGFSRAQDSIRIVHSMPLGMFRGAIGQALNHYDAVRQAKTGSVAETDASSPMEAKVLQWLHATNFVQGQPDDVEIIPQFPIGDYLKQLDPTYEHPAYRVDFLLNCRTDKGMVQIVIEYDGFQVHFDTSANVHVGNHAKYLKNADIERQLTLESYGYRFLRINRFNVGADPVKTLDERLARLIEVATGEQHVKFLDRLQAQAAGMVNKEMQQCTRCDQILPKKGFFDRSLRSGQGGYGRVCMGCKAKPRRQGQAISPYTHRW